MRKGKNGRLFVKIGKHCWYPWKFFENLLFIMSIVFFVWVFISLGQIMIHHDDFIQFGTHFEYPKWNAFVLMIDIGEKFQIYTR